MKNEGPVLRSPDFRFRKNTRTWWCGQRARLLVWCGPFGLRPEWHFGMSCKFVIPISLSLVIPSKARDLGSCLPRGISQRKQTPRSLALLGMTNQMGYKSNGMTNRQDDKPMAWQSVATRCYLRTVCSTDSRTPASLASFAALSVASQVKSGSLRPKWP